jgi:hypothetical protein
MGRKWIRISLVILIIVSFGIYEGQATEKKTIGKLKVSSEPQGAMILLNGRNMGITPKLLQEVEVGTHRLVLKMSGFCPWVEEIKVEKDKVTEVHAIMQSTLGTIAVNSTPRRAEVWMNGKLVGKTPTRIKDVEALKPHRIEVIIPGYSKWSSLIFTYPCSMATINILLHPLKYPPQTTYLYVRSIPSGADVYLNEKLIGKTPIHEAELKVGEYSLRIEKEGFTSVKEGIVALEKRPILVDFSLKKKEKE